MSKFKVGDRVILYSAIQRRRLVGNIKYVYNSGNISSRYVYGVEVIGYTRSVRPACIERRGVDLEPHTKDMNELI